MNFTVLSNSTSSSTSSGFPYWNIILAILAIVIGSGSIISLYYQNKMAKLRSIQEKLREDRRQFYFKLLDPFIFLFAKMPTIKQENKDEGQIEINNQFLRKLTSIGYKKTGFELSILGSYEVVKAYNNLMEYANLPTDPNRDEDKQISLVLYATLLLKIRKDLDSKTSFLKRLNEKDMLKSMNIKDVDTLDIPKLKNRYREIKYSQMKNKK